MSENEKGWRDNEHNRRDFSIRYEKMRLGQTKNGKWKDEIEIGGVHIMTQKF